MTPHFDDIASTTDSEWPTAYTPSTTTANPTSELQVKKDETITQLQSSILEEGSTFIIKNIATGNVITYHGGQVVLKPLDGHNVIRWECVKHNGWFGFKDPGSHRLLGYDWNEQLCCEATRQNLWEHFSVEQRPNGGYLLLMLHYDNWLTVPWKELRPVGIREVNGAQKLAVVRERDSENIGWVFIKV